MKLSVAADHGGFELKEAVVRHLRGLGHEVADHGTHSTDSCDYSDFVPAVCQDVRLGRSAFGILVCTTGVGMSIAANRFRGIRAVLCTDLYLAKYSRLHNDANVLCLPGRLLGEGLAEEICRIWLDTPFEGGRHLRRLEKLDAF